jgi:hypothetical protein
MLTFGSCLAVGASRYAKIHKQMEKQAAELEKSAEQMRAQLETQYPKAARR